MWFKILKYVAKYGPKAIKWAWANKWKLLALGNGVWEFIQSVWG